MTIRKILPKTESSLCPTLKVKNFQDPYIQQAIQDLKDTLTNHQKELDQLYPGKGMGVGLAANQIEYPYQPVSETNPAPKPGFYPKNFRTPEIYVVSIRTERAKLEQCEPIPLSVYINAQFSPFSHSTEEKPKQLLYEEGCLSIQGIKGYLVPRFENIKLSTYDDQGHPLNFTIDGFAARVHQHEIDHGEGDEFLTQMGLTEQELQEILLWIAAYRVHPASNFPGWIIHNKLQYISKDPDINALEIWTKHQLKKNCKKK